MRRARLFVVAAMAVASSCRELHSTWIIVKRPQDAGVVARIEWQRH